MNFINFKLLTFVCLVILGTVVANPVNANEVTLSFKKLYDSFLKNNLELKAEKEKLDSVELEYKIAVGQFFPTLELKSIYDETFAHNNEASNSKEFFTGLVLTQDLFNGFDHKNKLNIAKINLRNQKLSYEKALLDKSIELKKIVATVYYYQNLIKLLNDVIKSREDNVQIVDWRYSGGHEHKGSLLVAKAYQESSKLDLLNAENALRLEWRRLKNFIGDESLDTKVLIEDIYPHNSKLNSEKAYSEKWDFDLVTRQSLQSQINDLEVQKSNLEYKNAKASFLPTVTFKATEGITGPRFMGGAHDLAIQLKVTFPLFNGGRDYYGEKSLNDVRRSKIFNRDALFKKLVIDLEDAYFKYLNQIQYEKVQKSFVDAYKVTATIEKERYNNGLNDFSDWDSSENSYIDARKNLLEARYLLMVAYLDLEKLRGTSEKME